MIPVDGEEGPADVCVIELGGTIGYTPNLYFSSSFLFLALLLLLCKQSFFMFAGDIESAPFIEALGQFFYRVGKNHLNQKSKEILCVGILG